jgi:spermidine synthase
MDLRFFLLQLCFFVSGFAALLYETVWTREFAFVFGTSELAVSAVLAAYMAGLAAGAAIAARLAPRIRRPVLTYGLLELGIAIAALLVPYGVRALMVVYVRWFGGLDAPPETIGLATTLFHLTGAFVVMIPCTAMMGATLPLLARHAVQTDEQIGPRIGLLYGVNTSGAILGALFAAFVLLPQLGLRQTVYIGAVANFVVFVAAAVLARGVPAASTESLEPGGTHSARARWILPLMAVSGTISFVYEVLWARLLGFVLGASTAAFATMLASFLLGIAAGSAVASRLARQRGGAALGFVLAQLGAAIASWWAFWLADRLPEIASAIGAAPERLAPGGLTAVIALLPFTLCIGATFPFAVRLFAERASAAAAASARVYAWNTMGSIVGAVAAGFWLLPAFGFEGTLRIGVLGNLALAATASLLFLVPGQRRWPLVVAASLAATIVLVPLAAPLRLLKVSTLSGRQAPGAIEFLGVGRSATVTLIEEPHGWRLNTNGLPDASISRPEVPFDRMRPARLLALLPVLARPDVRDMLIIGLGGGGTLGSITPGLRSIDVIELEPEVVAANAAIAARRREGDPLADPRISLYLGDARGSLMLAERKYGAVVSQPSHPWTSGASHLYTREFFELVRSRLLPDGVFAQWIGLAFVDVEMVRSLLATLSDVFPYVEAYRPGTGALLFAASLEPFDVLATAKQAITSAPGPFGRVGVYDLEDVALARVLDAEGVRAASEGAELITDDHNLLASRVGRLRELRAKSGQIDELLGLHDPLPGSLADLDLSKLMRRLGALRDVKRGERLMPGLSEAQRHLARGWVQYENQRTIRAEKSFRKALAGDPDSVESRIGLVCLGVSEEEAGPLPPGVSDIARGLALRESEAWAELQALDGSLSRWGPGDLLFAEAARLRVAWRIATGEQRAGEEALTIIDRLLTRRTSAANYLARAEAAQVAGRTAYTWVSLRRLIELLPDAQARALAPRALEIAPDHVEGRSSEQTIERLQQAAGERR